MYRINFPKTKFLT